VTEDQWLTITSAEDASPKDVVITGIDGPNDGAGLWLKLVRLSNVSISGGIDKTPAGSFEDYVWFDHAEMYASNPNTIAEGDCWTFQGYGGAWSGVYYTDVHMTNTCDGPRDATFARNVFAEETGGGHSSGTATVINYSVKTIYGPFYMPGWPDYHGDIYQMFGRKENIVIYGASIVPGGMIASRGIVGSDGTIADVAIVNTDITTEGWVFSYCGNAAGPFEVDHMVVKDSRFVGASDWCGESPGGLQPDPALIVNVLIDHSTFENGSAEKVPQPWDLPGIKYNPPIQ
jgi:hypothetical protein